MKTNKTKLLLTIYLFSAMTVVIGCSKDDVLNPSGDCGGEAWTARISNELNAWNVAGVDYSNDPTPANCTSFVNAGQAYLNVLEDIRICVPGTSRQAFEQALEDAKTELANTDCSGS